MWYQVVFLKMDTLERQNSSYIFFKSRAGLKTWLEKCTREIYKDFLSGVIAIEIFQLCKDGRKRPLQPCFSWDIYYSFFKEVFRNERIPPREKALWKELIRNYWGRAYLGEYG